MKIISKSKETPYQDLQKIAESSSYSTLDKFTFQDEKEKIIKYNKNYIKAFNEIPPTSIDHYSILKQIGKGAFAEVSLGIHKLTGKYVAIKTINKDYIKDEHSRKKVLQEVYIHKKMIHPNIIRLFEVFEGLSNLYIVMEYASNGDLLQYVKQNGKLDSNEARRIFKGIIYGLSHIHSRTAIHRDIKLDNILLDEKRSPKIADFGVSRLITKDQFISEQCGTPAYLAPEIIKNKV